MDDEDLYDEFGNYIGDDAADSDDDEGYGSAEAPASTIPVEEDMEVQEDDENSPEPGVSSAIMLHEDKRYYPEAQEVFGEDVEILVQDTDTRDLSQPIVEPITTRSFSVQEAELPEVFYSRGYQASMMGLPELIRNVAIVGQLHHGKTSLLDMLVAETHALKPDPTGKREGDQLLYTDTHVLEANRGISIQAAPMSLLLENHKGKSHLFNIVDTPGHVDFIDEVAVASRLADGLVLVLDVIEGVQVNTRRILQLAVRDQLPIVLVLNKIDRLSLELRLPPEDAYFKIMNVLDSVNEFMAEIDPLHAVVFSADNGNLIFACASLQFCFTVNSFARMYADRSPAQIDSHELAKRMWGNIYYDPETRKFLPKASAGGPQTTRSFIHFVLSPLYKIFAHSISKEHDELRKVLAKLGVFLKPAAFKMNAQPLLKHICKLVFRSSAPLVDVILEQIPSPIDAAASRISTTYTGPLDSPLAQSMTSCNQDGPLIVNVVKLYSSPDALEMYALGRVMSGTLREGSAVSVLGEGYTVDDDEDMVSAHVSQLWIPQTRYKVPVDAVPAGNWVLIAGVDSVIVKTATIVEPQSISDSFIFKPIKHVAEPVFKVAVEPINPSELPKMLDGLRKVSKTYALVQTKVEESGEHVILGSGEMYLDCILHDLRILYADMDIKVSDPVTRFAETCVETSAIKCYAETPNKRNKITIIAEPLESQVVQDIESGKINVQWPEKERAKHFQNEYKWDALAARSIWAFGPDDLGPNILLDDTLPGEVDKKQLKAVSASIRQGFQWSTREGPLCEEPIRSTKFRIIDSVLAEEPIYRGGGQIIPTTRRACYSAFLLASPRLLEPVYSCHAICSGDSVSVVYDILGRRRGNVLTDRPIAGTPLYYVEGLVPVIDSFGFEADVRVASQGKATVSLVFDSWDLVPGDPLDKDQTTRPLTAAQPRALARDFVLKTRRRKGLSEEPTVDKYLDESLIKSLKESGLLD